MTMERQRKNLRIYEAVSYEVALDASKHGIDLTPDERAEVYRFADAMQARIRTKQRADRAGERAVRVRPSILAMARGAIIRRFAELLVMHPTAVFAHRDLTALTDDDLRTALEDAETLAARIA